MRRGGHKVATKYQTEKKHKLAKYVTPAKRFAACF